MGTFLFLPISGFFLLLLLLFLFFQLGRQQALLHLDGMAFNVSAEFYGMPQLFQLLCQSFDLRGLRFTAVELLTLFYEDSDFILGFLPNSCKLTSVLYFIFENELRLLDPLIQPADILPHSVAGVSVFFRKYAHLV